MRRARFILASVALAAAAVAATPTHAGAQTSAQNSSAGFLTGTGDGESPDVHVYNSAAQQVGAFNAHSSRSGARVAAGDVDGDQSVDYITATGSGVGSQVIVRVNNGASQSSFAPFGSFAGGVWVAVGDLVGDARAEIVTAAGQGGGPHVIVWQYNGGQLAPVASWFAYDTNFRGGVRVAVGDVVGSSRGEVVTATGPGGGPHVRMWQLSGSSVADAGGFFAYDGSWTGGVSVGAGLVDGTRSVVTGVGPGGGPHVRVFNGNGVVRSEFYAYPGGFGGGVNVAVGAGANNGHVLVAPASWGGPHVKATTGGGATLFEFFAYATSRINGVHIAGFPQFGSSSTVNQS